MAEIVKQVVGIDVAQNEIVVSLGRMNHDTGVDIYMPIKYLQIL